MSSTTTDWRPATVTQKILARAADQAYVEVGQIVHPRPDLVIVHDGYVETAYRELSALGFGAIVDPDRTVFVTDHAVAYNSDVAIRRGATIRRAAAEWKVGRFYDVGQGGHGHLFPIEKGLIEPAMFVMAYDMHCTNFGSVGALAISVGTEVTAVLATGTVWTPIPETVRIDLTGQMQPGTYARDIGFHVATALFDGRWGADYDFRVIEFGGPGVSGLSLHERVALCNSITEIGVASVIFDVGDVRSDDDAPFQSRVTVDLGSIEPQVAQPGGPEKAVPLSAVAGLEVQHTFIGSCGSGMYEDFAVAAELLAGRRVAEGVRLFVTPGTVDTANRLAGAGLFQVFTEAGAIVLPPGCGPCAGGLMAPLGEDERSISTAATNHQGRFGAGEAYLASPATVVASAVAGRISDPRALLQEAR